MNRTVDIAARSKLLRKFEHDETRSQRAFVAQRVEMRAAADSADLLNFVGYACVTDAPYDIWGGAANGGWSETVVRGAFNKTLSERPDVAFLINHQGMTLARTKSGTLTLAADDQGLAVEASLDARQSPVRDLQVAMERGDIDEMSFAFRVIRDRWLNADGEEVPWWDMAGIDRHILEVSLQKGDVSVVNYGANPATSADLRTLFAEARAGKPMTKERRDLILIALGDLSLDGTSLTDASTETDNSVDSSIDNSTETETPDAPAPAAASGMSLSLARALATASK